MDTQETRKEFKGFTGVACKKSRKGGEIIEILIIKGEILVPQPKKVVEEFAI